MSEWSIEDLNKKLDELICDPPCLLSMDSRPAPNCLSVHVHNTCAKWVPVEGIILSEVPA